MPSGQVYVKAVNWVYDTIKAAAEGATFSYVKKANVLLGGSSKPLQQRVPGVVVVLNLPDAIKESWQAMLKSRGATATITAQCYCHPADQARPYGSDDGTKVGVLTMAQDVANAVENAANGLRLGGNALSVDVTYGNVGVEGEGLYKIDVDFQATLRFDAGAR